MSLISTETKMKVTSRNATYYEKLGYIIPRKTGKQGKPVIAVGETIMVRVCDLPRYSNAEVLAKCDCCKEDKILR